MVENKFDQLADASQKNIDGGKEGLWEMGTFIFETLHTIFFFS